MRFLPKDRIAEANIQAEAYHQLKLLNIPCYLEYKVDNCRFDMVLVSKDRFHILAIIEFKSHGEKRLKRNPGITKGKQYNKYMQYGLPLLHCTTMRGIPDLIKSCQEVYEKGYCID